MQQPDHADEWFVPQLIGDLIVSGKLLTEGQCYSYELPPMLSGKMELSNFEPTDLLVHCSMFGQIGRQIQHLPDGTKIDGVNGLRQVLLRYQDQFARVVGERLLTYALGRGVEAPDMPLVRSLVREAAPSKYRMSSLILGIVKSPSFQMNLKSSDRSTQTAAK